MAKTIKELALEAYPIKMVKTYGYLPVQTSQAVNAGANYVIDIIEQCLTPQKCFTEHGIDICAEALVKTALQTIEQLKK